MDLRPSTQPQLPLDPLLPSQIDPSPRPEDEPRHLSLAVVSPSSASTALPISNPPHLPIRSSTAPDENLGPTRLPSVPPSPFVNSASQASPRSENSLQMHHSSAQLTRHTLPSLDNVVSGTVSSNSTDRYSLTNSQRATSSSVSPPISFEEQESFSNDGREGYDWNLFVAAYASGQWDPTSIPHPPRPTMFSPQRVSHSESSSPQDMLRPKVLRRAMTSSSSLGTIGLPGWSRSESDNSTIEVLQTHSSPRTAALLEGNHGSLSRKRAHTPTFPTGSLSSLGRTDSLITTVGASPIPGVPSPSIASGNSEIAATLRWASSGLSVRPLVLPSPERELTDPLHIVPRNEPPIVIEHFNPPTIPRPISAGLPTPPVRIPVYRRTARERHATERAEQTSLLVPIPGSPNQSINRVAPASAPILNVNGNATEEDYFSVSTAPDSTADLEASTWAGEETAASNKLTRLELSRHISEPLPASPAGVLPPSSNKSLQLSSSPIPLKPSENIRHPPQEDFYCENLWLSPPNPPDELDRLRALYRYNILYTSKDSNFDRITHLAKLVFQSKGVCISLIDSDTQWIKAEAGQLLGRRLRKEALCAHTILQRSDEAVVVLDTTADWRFTNNPQVIGPPYIRFYAGAPLRTSDGYNIGSLCLLDDHPWSEFTPRNRHALKEFAAIIMREMELWRDKILLRIRERIQVSMEHFTRECLQLEPNPESSESHPSSVMSRDAMDKIYQRAANLVKTTLDVEGACVMDVSRSGLHDPSNNSEGQISVMLYSAGHPPPVDNTPLSQEDYADVVSFFGKHPDGVVTEGIPSGWFETVLPSNVLHALLVPIFNIDQRPFALLIAYNTTGVSRNFLDGHELSYLRAIGVIILSAVLKRRMSLADKAKSLFISNISHELRTPLHGILAAAELLEESHLNHHQQSFLQTVQACGASLVETVNHVLDYTKLSGNTRAGGVEHVIPPSRTDLMQLIEEAVEGGYVGFNARFPTSRSNEIGTVYSPPTAGSLGSAVETVIDIGYRSRGWNLTFEKGGIRRILMNLIGNSLKFTSNGYVQITLRSLPHSSETPFNKVRVEIGVNDTGKGISAEFLRTQLFEPFSQENPLQTGTGLGLAIVKSIVHSKGVDGKLDVSSIEGVGTDMRIVFEAEDGCTDDEDTNREDRIGLDSDGTPISVEFVGFDKKHRGSVLLKDTLSEYMRGWWKFDVVTNGQSPGEVLIVDEDFGIMDRLQGNNDFSRPIIILSSLRGDAKLMSTLEIYEKSGAFCRIIYKPCGPTRLKHVLKMCVAVAKMKRNISRHPSVATSTSRPVHAISQSVDPSSSPDSSSSIQPPLSRRRSEETRQHISYSRPQLGARSSTFHHAALHWVGPENHQSLVDGSPPASPSLTVNVGAGATLLKSSINTVRGSEAPRVLVVEDNNLLRSLLVKWLGIKGYRYAEATDGQQAVDVFEQEGPFDIILIDVSMPILDGIQATTEIRKLEAVKTTENAMKRKQGQQGREINPTRILALTGMSGLEDKRRAFEAGVDGYLIKPVAFNTLEALFQRLGI